MAKIRFIKNSAGIGFGHFAGDVADYPEAICEHLIEIGYAKPEAEEAVKVVEVETAAEKVEAMTTANTKVVKTKRAK